MGIPEMRRRGYPDDVATGSICAGGTLGILIPPSVMLIVYGAVAGVSVVQLYAGAFLTALALPGTIEGLQGSDLGPGWGTLFFGLAFLFIAAVRAWRNGGVGWQAFYGTILVLIGGSQIAKPDLAAVAWPVLLVVVGAVLLIRGTQRG